MLGDGEGCQGVGRACREICLGAAHGLYVALPMADHCCALAQGADHVHAVQREMVQEYLVEEITWVDFDA